jgi:hypothetical protein
MNAVVSADVILSGTATRVGEPASPTDTNPEGAGRAQIKICGTMATEISDLRTCTFTLMDAGFDLSSAPGGIFDTIDAKRGGKATEVQFQSDQRQRPTLKAQVKNRRGDGNLEFCLTIDRTVIDPAPVPVDPCADGDVAEDLPLAFDLDCDDGLFSFSEAADWRVPTNGCPADGFPNMRVFKP